MILSYKYKIKNPKRVLDAQARAVNFVWNYCNALQKEIQNKYNAGARVQIWPSNFDLQKLCKGVGKEIGIHQQTINEVCSYFTIARDRAKHPLKFRKSYGNNKNLGWIPFQKQSRQIEGNKITYLGSCYSLFGVKNRPIPETVKGGHFVQDINGNWFICFYVEVVKSRETLSDRIGIDLGLKDFAVLSNGRKIEAKKVYRNYESQLQTAQKAGNKNRVRRIHTKIKNCRNDFLHKLSTELAGQNALIAVGNVSAKQLSHTKMAKSAYDAGWSIFRAMLKYKSIAYVEVDEKFTTQTCSHCGSKDSSERPRGIAGLGIREWKCSDCGEIHDRDVNAAKNILSLALGMQCLAEEKSCFLV